MRHPSPFQIASARPRVRCRKFNARADAADVYGVFHARKTITAPPTTSREFCVIVCTYSIVVGTYTSTHLYTHLTKHNTHASRPRARFAPRFSGASSSGLRRIHAPPATRHPTNMQLCIVVVVCVLYICLQSSGTARRVRNKTPSLCAAAAPKASRRSCAFKKATASAFCVRVQNESANAARALEDGRRTRYERIEGEWWWWS